MLALLHGAEAAASKASDWWDFRDTRSNGWERINGEERGVKCFQRGCFQRGAQERAHLDPRTILRVLRCSAPGALPGMPRWTARQRLGSG
jgi:hypothetical protein